MSSIICLLLGLILGSGLCYLAFNQVLTAKDDIIEDYKKGQYNDLIEFALWRTRMCRYLYSHAEFLDEYVYKKIKMVGVFPGNTI